VLATHHSQRICSIVAHCKDRTVAAATIPCLALAGGFLVDRQQQEEVLRILDSITKETGWPTDRFSNDLRTKWNWRDAHDEEDSGNASLSNQSPPTTPNAQSQMVSSTSWDENVEPPPPYTAYAHGPITGLKHGPWDSFGTSFWEQSILRAEGGELES
jgi:hypothetical protein